MHASVTLHAAAQAALEVCRWDCAQTKKVCCCFVAAKGDALPAVQCSRVQCCLIALTAATDLDILQHLKSFDLPLLRCEPGIGLAAGAALSAA